MIQFFLRLYDLLQQHKRITLAGLFGVIALLLLMMSQLKYNENIYDFLPMSGNEQKAISVYQDISGGQRIFVLFKIKASKEADAVQLPQAIDMFAEELEAHDGRRHISQVTKQVDFEKFAGITDFIYHNIPLLLTADDYRRMEQLLATHDWADRQLAEDVQMIMMPATGFFTSNISNDPFGLFTPVMERLQKKQASLPVEIDNGYLFTAGKGFALVMLDSPYGSMESAKNAELVAYVDSVAQTTMQKVIDVEIDITGSPVIAVGNAQQIKQDSQWAISIAVTLILMLLIAAFKKVRNLLLIGAAIVFGWIFAMAFIAILRNDVSLIVLGIGSIIIGIAVNYPLHFIAHTSHSGSTREVLKEMVAPLLIGNITTVGAFAALMPLDAPALRDLGLFAAFMLIGTILFVLIFLPHLVSKRTTDCEERLLFGKLSTASPERHKWLMGVIAVLTVVLGYFSLYTSFDTNMHHINYMTERQTNLLSAMHASAGVNDTTNVYLVSEGKNWEEALSERARITPLIDSLRRTGLIESCSDVTAYIPSQQEQQSRIEQWNTFWREHQAEILSQLKEKAPEYGFNVGAFEPFKEIIAADYQPQPFEHFDLIRSVLLNSSFSESNEERSVVEVLQVNKEHKKTVEATFNEEDGLHSYAFDFVGMNSSVANALSNDFNYIGFACGFIVFIFLWLSFGRLELSLLAFLPMALGWIWILGLMYLFGMQFNIVNVILATFIFGQGDDYTIFMTDGIMNEYAYKKRILPSFKNSIIISALIMFIGMGSLIVARHPALHSLAEVTIVGMLTVVLMAWIVPPLVFNWMVNNNGKNRHMPLTLGQLARTGVSTLVYLFQLTYGCVLGYLSKVIPCTHKARENWFHRLIYTSMKFNIRTIPGVKIRLHNPNGEDFSRGSILIANHQSILDPALLLAMNPKILLLISEKVWKNPLVHTLFRLARFINLNQPMEQLKEQIAVAVADGYNVVIFPEGKRNNNRITRFHKGAFSIAQEIGADLLPVYLHGADHVMPKGSGVACKGQIDVEIGKRIPATEIASLGSTQQAIASACYHDFFNHFKEMKQQTETTHYFHDFLVARYTYKGIALERETRHLLTRFNDFAQWIDIFDDKQTNRVSVLNNAHGQFSLMFALVHPEVEVHSYHTDEDDIALLNAMEPKPKNLHIHRVQDGEIINTDTEHGVVYDFHKITAN